MSSCHVSRRLCVAPGRHLHVREEGAGPPVLLLHGFTGSGETMRPAAAPLAGARCLFVDLLGHGRSDTPEPPDGPDTPVTADDPGPWGMETAVADLAAVLDALGIGSAGVVGYSLGARVALGFAVAHPERVRGLALVGGRAGIADPGERAARIRADAALADRILAAGLEAFVEHWMALPLFASQARLGAAALARARAQRLRNRPEGLARSLRGLGAGAQPPLFDRLPGLERPVLLLTGAEDERFGALAEELARLLPDARHRVVARAGHAVHLENPQAFHDEITRFLPELTASPQENPPCPVP